MSSTATSLPPAAAADPAGGPPVTHVTTAAAARALAAAPAIRDPRRRPPPVVLRLPGLAEERGRAVGARVNALLAECGCSAGKTALTAAATVLAAVAAPGAPHVPFDGTAQTVACAMWILGAAGAGKLTGILRARARAVVVLHAAAAESDAAPAGGA